MMTTVPNVLPNLRLLRHLIMLTEDDQLVRTATQRPATVPHNTTRQPLVVIGFYVLDAQDVREALTFGAWPDAAAGRGLTTAHVSQRDWSKANDLMEHNSLKLERTAAEEAA